MNLFLDQNVDVDLPPPMRFRLRIYLPDIGSPVVVIEETADNPGPPAAHVVSRLARLVRTSYLPSYCHEPIWIEAWLGRALSALMQDALPFATYMRVLPDTDPPERAAVSAAELATLTGSAIDGPPPTA
jgi:hypothetical protein